MILSLMAMLSGMQQSPSVMPRPRIIKDNMLRAASLCSSKEEVHKLLDEIMNSAKLINSMLDEFS